MEINDRYEENATILIISHGSIISYMKRILDIKSKHLQTGTIDIFKNVNFDNVIIYKKSLNDLLIN